MNQRAREAIYPEHSYIPTGRTNTLPASEERIQAYRSRAAANQSVFVEGDLEEDERRGLPGMPHAPNGKQPRRPRNETQTECLGEGGSALPHLRFSSILRLMRRRLGWTQGELARRAGISKRMVKYYEYGNYRPTYFPLQRLAAALGVTVMELFGT